MMKQYTTLGCGLSCPRVSSYANEDAHWDYTAVGR
jgi:hypothetical protein